MTEDRPLPAEIARLLRQRLEMGAGEIFLEGLTREQALRLVTAARAAGGPSQPTASRPAPASHSAVTQPPNGEPGTDPTLPDDYDALRQEALQCTRCRLCEGRTQVVFSDGPRDARLMVVGEAPGANEDQTGVPFVGAAGQYLDLLLATVGLSREESVYIANVLKCRPPGNRDPKPDEIETCSPFLKKQIDLVRPHALLAVGSFSGKLLTRREKVSLGKLRGAVHSYHGVPLVVTYHPAALLRNPRWVRPFWDDLQLLREVLAGAGEDP
ncbi:MAG: uracil-DNA glycosylase [Gemmatimonadetes bacterium]|nr:uracil-DNA glycosylase [Gemmatimonadota bacterium]NNF14727.1 uracil-DNA glycosylase [Gemmatimonadota bacterium]